MTEESYQWPAEARSWWTPKVLKQGGHRHFYRVLGRNPIILDSWLVQCECGAFENLRRAA